MKVQPEVIQEELYDIANARFEQMPDEDEYYRSDILLIALFADEEYKFVWADALMDDIEQSRTEDTDPYDVFTLAYNLEDDKRRDSLYERLKATGFDVEEFLDD